LCAIPFVTLHAQPITEAHHLAFQAVNRAGAL
jgi:hypothetical protein